MLIADWLVAVVMSMLLATRAAAWSRASSAFTPNAMRLKAVQMPSFAAEISTSAAPGHVIASPANPFIKRIRSLHQRKYRDETGFVLVEGVKLLSDVVQSGFVPESVVSTQEFMQSDQGRSIAHLLEQAGVSIQLATGQVVQSISDTETPQGVIGVLRKPTYDLGKVLSSLKQAMLVAMDGIQDPGNAGTLVRSCAVLGADAVLAMNSADVWSPKSIRASAGAVFQLPVMQLAWPDFNNNAATRLKEQGFQFYAADVAKDGQLHHSVDWSSNTLLMIGSEGRGLSNQAKKFMQDVGGKSVKIAMKPGTESLNAAIAGSIILAEAARQKATLPS